MDNSDDQLVQFVARQLQQGVPEATIRQTLQSNGWDETRIHQSLTAAKGLLQTNPTLAASPEQKKRTRTALLWIFSPFIAWFGAIIVMVICQALGFSSAVLNIITMVAGLGGVILLVVGPVVGILQLTRRK